MAYDWEQRNDLASQVMCAPVDLRSAMIEAVGPVAVVLGAEESLELAGWRERGDGEEMEILARTRHTFEGGHAWSNSLSSS